MILDGNEMTKLNRKYSMGIDIGSRTTKSVIWDGIDLVGKVIVSTGWTPDKTAEKAYHEVLKAAQMKKVDRVYATGYGRVSVTEHVDDTVTEITAHARGVGQLLPEARTLIDIGGQDSKAILLEAVELVVDFAMNDRCAAGSGKFLEFLAMTMELSIKDFADLAALSTNPVQITSLCTVFAESEVLSLLAEGARRRDVAAGIHRAIAIRVAQMALSLHPQAPIAFAGGVALNQCMVNELSHAFNSQIVTPEIPEFTGALGAAIIAMEGL